MIWVRSRRTLRAITFLRFSPYTSYQPNAPLDIDKSFRTILQDIDASIVEQKLRGHHPRPDVHELTVYPTGSQPTELVRQDGEEDVRAERKSPSALFGSQQLGVVAIPQELQQTISALISDSDKHLLRRDSKRLFNARGDEDSWDPALNVRYRSYKQERLHAERDGIAFASVVLPAHFSAIYAVLRHIRSRLGMEWTAQNVFDWGAGTGSALWATSYAFQKPDFHNNEEGHQVTLSSAAIVKYVGIEKRVGLVSVGKQLLEDVQHDNLDVTWHRKFPHDGHTQSHDGNHTIAISAFFLSTLQTSLQKKRLVKEMWESGAGIIVLLDHSNPAGFQNIAEARELLLRLGQKHEENGKYPIPGSHVLAPCPHDGVCPIHQSNVPKLVCGFSQRIERPPFIRLTKHSGVGHEDIGYSYVVIRRGPRPSIPDIRVGRLGEVGRQQIELREVKRALIELELDDGNLQTPPPPVVPSTLSKKTIEPDGRNLADVENLMRAEAFHWPRLVFPPLKRSGHVVMDVCSPSGNILRMTIPKSQGKQPYYDARKSRWGDIFPHGPKNSPQVRYPRHQDQLGQGGNKKLSDPMMGTRFVGTPALFVQMSFVRPKKRLWSFGGNKAETHRGLCNFSVF
ncbi:Rsm22-domain-containing protein [Russula earlei]|uniref:Rsm22-domain-containing protein n=1 Tax=Russula earlei TaxID=71964 RepID=A0ACC0UKH6_9AGAM|nr:Rsm22-domain-containing protein [Russula earlei]